MIYLGASRTDLSSKADDWRDRLHAFLFKDRENKVWVMDGRKKISSHDSYFVKMEKTVEYLERKGVLSAAERKWIKDELAYFKRNFDNVVKAEESEMERQAKAYSKRAKKTTQLARDEYKDLMVKLYDAFADWDSGKGKPIAYYFFEELNIRTCPYCNRQYTFTLHTSKAKTSPEYDHFYDKADYPLLAVSFYNLVPSCHTCNHVKGKNNTAKVNPYFKGFDSKFYLYDRDDTNHRLNAAEMLVKGDGVLKMRKEDDSINIDEQGNIDTFGLKGLYDMHDDFVRELLEKAVSYDKTAREQLADAFQKRGYTPDHVYDFIWGKYLEDVNLDNRLLSKLTKDLLEQLEIEK